MQFLELKWKDGHRHIPMDVVNNVTATSPPANKKETSAFLDVVDFWRMYVLGCSQLVGPLYWVTQKKNYFKWGLAAGLQIDPTGDSWCGHPWARPDRPAARSVLCAAAREHGFPGSLGQKTPGETRGHLQGLGIFQ